MEENKYAYTPEEGYDYEKEENEAIKKSLRGYRVVIILLAIILAGLSVLYFNLNRQQQQDYALLQADRDTIQSNLNSLIVEYDGLKYQNDTIAAQLEKAKEMVEQLKYERRLNYNKIKANLKEVGTLRADVAEERASELQNKVAQGSVLRARDITLVALTASDKIISRVKNAATLRVDFTVGANELAKAGNRQIYLCITTPDGYLLSTDAMPTFSYQGTNKGYSASREVDYQNEHVDVSIYY